MNRRERKVATKLKEEGWNILTKGYPDLFCYRKNEIMFVEVKRKQKRPTKKMGLSKYQRKMIEILKGAGLKVIVEYVN